MRIRSMWCLVVLVSMLALSACGATATVVPTATASDASATATAVVMPATATVVAATIVPTIIATPGDMNPGMGLNPVPLAAVQTVVDYYTAIDAQQYPAAYKLWDNPSQTLAQITAVFTGTVESRVRIAEPTIAMDIVTLPVTITAVVNQANGDQKVQYFAGTYTVKNNLITDATLTTVAAPASGDDNDPAQLVTNYYTAISARKFGMAYTLWSHNGSDSQLPYAGFVQSLAPLQGAVVTTGTVQQEGAAGSTYATVPTVSVTTQADGTAQVLCGTYTLRHVNVQPFDQLGWRITQVAMNPIVGAQSDAPTIQKLLASGCTP
ncbi:MAG: hypothetical protein EBS29_08275 [Chloroflexia bacterium]|nr:hypothetical protein [Chloroflexia bacterium]